MMKLFIHLFLLLTAVLPVAAQEAVRVDSTLNAYLRMAAENNPELRAVYTQYLAALEEVPQVNSLPDPELSFGYFITPIETRVGPQTMRLGLTQMFPWFGTLNARSDAASQQAKARFEAFREHRNRLFFRVKSAWYDLYELEESIGILRENIEILESFESLALRRYEAAQVSQVDVLRVQIEKNDLETRLELLKDNRNLKIRTFNELLNRPGTEIQPVAGPLEPVELPAPADSLISLALRQNPGIGRLEYEVRSAQHTIAAARKEGLPKFGLGFDYIITGERTMAMTDNGKDAAMARIGIQIPIYRAKYRAKEQQSRFRMQSLQEQRFAAENRLSTQMEEALRDYYDARRKAELYSELQVQRTRQAIDILLEEYAAAGAEFEELLRMQQRLLDYRLSYAQALVNQQTAIAYINYLSGINQSILD